MADCLLGLGSNLNDRLANLKQVLDDLTAFVKIVNISSVYETEAIGYTYQGWFLNMAVSCRFDNDPLNLLSEIQKIQSSIINPKTFKYAPRFIDIDILTFDNLIINTPQLTIPHSGITDRLFILISLKEISPDFIHPSSGLHIDQLIKNCPDNSEVNRLGNLFDINDWKVGDLTDV